MTQLSALSNLLPIGKIPEELGIVKEGLSSVFSKLYFKKLYSYYINEANGMSFMLVSNSKISIEIAGGDGIALVVNPGYSSSSPSEFQVSCWSKWILRDRIGAFDLDNFDFSPSSFFDIILETTGLDNESILRAAVLGFFHEDHIFQDPIDLFIDTFNNYYEPPTDLVIPSGANDLDAMIDDLITQMKSNGNSYTPFIVVFDLYINSGTTTDDKLANLETLFRTHFGSFTLDSFKEILLPQFAVTFSDLNVALEFPRTFLVPVDANSEPIADESVKSRLTFTIGSLTFNSSNGFSFEKEASFALDKSEILGTGFILEATGIKLDLSEGRNIPEADADGRAKSFKGIYLETAVIEFPKDFQEGANPKNPSLVGRNLLIGSEGGLSGTIEANAAGTFKFDLFGTEVELNQFGITFHQNTVTGSSITGWMRIPQLQDSTGNEVVLNVTVAFSSAGWSIQFEEPEGIAIRVKGLLTIKLFKLKIGKENGNFFLEVKADGEREFSIPFVDKVLPIGVLIDTLRFEEGEPTTANVFPRWEGPVPVTFTDNGVKVRLDINKEFFKILKVNYLDIGVETITDGIDASLLFNGGLNIGPLVATAGGLGLETSIVKTNGKGNIGPFDVNASFVPPSEIGLSVKTKAVTGGGYLWLDPDSGNYSGAIELSFKDKFDLKAIGILSTKLPDGQKGFSLLIIVTAKFSPVQLGFGFTLSGVGGLLGLHRSVNKEELKLGVRDNKLDNILFPENVVENASTIISQMQTVFPIRKGQFVIGPMGLIGWGAPVSLIDAELGVIIEVPNPVMVAIVGVVKIALPDKDAPIALLQINFAGIIDFENKMFSFDASLYQSRILTFALTGDMALRIKWGDKPDFGFAIGGFHPDYEVPTALGFPEMRRLTLSLFDTALLRVNLETYFAVTSNTVQTGAKIDAFAGSGEFYAEAILYYDVLLQFNPFRLTADIGAMVGIKMGKRTILTAKLDVHLEGPKPWYIEGEVEFTFLAINYSIDFKETIGEEQQAKQVASIDAWTKLKDALEHKSNWQAIQPAANSQLVSLKDEGKEASALMVHPFGTLAFKQSVLPFDFELEKFGNGKPKDYKKYKIDSVEDGASNTYTTSDELEFFAPAEYIKMSDDDKLGRDSFQQFKGGARLSGTCDRSTDHYARKPIAYEKKVVDEPESYDKWEMPENTFDFEILLASASISPASASNYIKAGDAPDALSIEQATYKVKSIEDLSDFTTTEFENEWAAMQYIQQQEIADPALEQKLTVLSTIEEE